MDIREEIHDLSMNFEACHKTLSAIRDDTRQHIILELMRIDYNVLHFLVWPILSTSVFADNKE